MNKFKKFMKSPAILVILFVVAAGLIIGGSIGGARAVLQDSDTFKSQLELYSIDVELTGDAVESADDGKSIIVNNTEKKFAVGKYYDVPVNATNTGAIDEYVRIVFTRYWEKDGEKDITLDPTKIDLVFSDDWIFDEEYSTDERLIYYYPSLVAVGDSTADLLEKVCIDSSIAKDKNYDGADFIIEAEVDAVQTHNAEHAIISAWGRDVTVSGNTLSLD